ncbi:MAG: glutamine synthetase III [Clostridia bacterium]|nr:glutamine synthetase III [Clostridia bacterium]
MSRIPALFGSMVFGDAVMKERLPAETYRDMKDAIRENRSLDRSVADIVANAMKDWAVEKGATHYTHWFQPLTGITAEKHDSFISPAPNGGVIMEFSGKELIRGEPDASSFPSGGLRTTFEARGYTAWDPTSPAFIKDGTLCIPTAFCGYGGQALDKKTPLLRSMEAINTQTMRLLRLFGMDCESVTTTVGAEQEYFIIDKEVYEQRKDLIYCGRTLLGALPPKGQELDDHYFGVIKPRVSAFMRELDERLWELGVLAKTEHNEAAPAQHELAPIFSTTNIACDHNQLTMELLKKVADRHGLVCLLHEKPFAGVNGSGKHNNWSLTTSDGINLLNPGKTPADNSLFLLVLCAVIAAVDENQDLLRISVATAGNDHRLGAAEAPPAIVSMFIGDELSGILDAYEQGVDYRSHRAPYMESGVGVLPHFRKDTTDRNRTSPFAFTGNKFEFRMLGSSISIGDPNIVLNTIVAESFRRFADELEGAADFDAAVTEIIRRTVADHKRIVFNGDGYSAAWEAEAEARGLLNLRSTVDALPHFVDEKNIALFSRHGVFSAEEMHARCDIMLENYSKIVNIEALTLIEMVEKDVYPAVLEYENTLCDAILAKKSTGLPVSVKTESDLLCRISALGDALYEKLGTLKAAEAAAAEKRDDTLALALHYRKSVVAAMEALRSVSDELETAIPSEIWPYPSYGDLLFSVK